MQLHKIDPGNYYKHLMLFHNGQFACHHRFPWFAFNTIQRAQALGAATEDQARALNDENAVASNEKELQPQSFVEDEDEPSAEHGNADDDHGPENPGNDGGRTGNLCGGPGTKQPAGADQGVQRQHDSRKETYFLYF